MIRACTRYTAHCTHTAGCGRLCRKRVQDAARVPGRPIYLHEPRNARGVLCRHSAGICSVAGRDDSKAGRLNRSLLEPRSDIQSAVSHNAGENHQELIDHFYFIFVEIYCAITQNSQQHSLTWQRLASHAQVIGSSVHESVLGLVGGPALQPWWFCCGQRTTIRSSQVWSQAQQSAALAAVAREVWRGGLERVFHQSSESILNSRPCTVVAYTTLSSAIADAFTISTSSGSACGRPNEVDVVELLTKVASSAY